MEAKFASNHSDFESSKAEHQGGTPAHPRRVSINELGTQENSASAEDESGGSILESRPSLPEELLDRSLLKEARMSYKEVTEERLNKRRDSLKRVPPEITEKASDETEEAIKVVQREAAFEIVQWAINDVKDTAKQEIDYVRDLIARPTASRTSQNTWDDVNERKSQRLSQRPSNAAHADAKAVQAAAEEFQQAPGSQTKLRVPS
jgi:hypothetical protein